MTKYLLDYVCDDRAILSPISASTQGSHITEDTQ